MAKKKISYEAELWRKSIHLASILIPLFYYFTSKEITLIFISIIATITLSIDILSKPKMPLQKVVDKYLGFMIRKHEKSEKWWRLNGASWVTISALITFAIFPKFIAITSFFVLILADMGAALIGRRFGTHKIKPYKKTLEGSVTFFVIALVVNSAMGYFHSAYFIFYIIGGIACFWTTLAELVSKKWKVDDNLFIPITYSVIMYAYDLLFLDSINSFSNLL